MTKLTRPAPHEFILPVSKLKRETFQKTVTKTATTKTSGTQPIYHLCQVTISHFIGQQLDHKYLIVKKKFSISSMDRK